MGLGSPHWMLSQLGFEAALLPHTEVRVQHSPGAGRERIQLCQSSRRSKHTGICGVTDHACVGYSTVVGL